MALGFLEDIGISKDGVVGGFIGNAVGALFGPAAAGIGAVGGFVGGSIKSIKKKAYIAKEKAYNEAEDARIRSVMRDYGSQKQTMDTISAGFKRGKVGRGSAIPDPIADTSGFIGDGLDQGSGIPSTSGTF